MHIIWNIMKFLICNSLHMCWQCVTYTVHFHSTPNYNSALKHKHCFHSSSWLMWWWEGIHILLITDKKFKLCLEDVYRAKDFTLLVVCLTAFMSYLICFISSNMTALLQIRRHHSTLNPKSRWFYAITQHATLHILSQLERQTYGQIINSNTARAE